MPYGVKAAEVCRNCKTVKMVTQACPACGGGILDHTISLSDYLTDFPERYPDQFSKEIKENAIILLNKVNKLVTLVRKPFNFSWSVTSGWRPAAYNASIGGSLRSRHITGEAIDLHDPDFWLQRHLTIENPDLLRVCDLAMEDPAYCMYENADKSRGGWVHLQSVLPRSGNRVFIPYPGPPVVRKKN